MANSCSFTTDTPRGTLLDPHKRVRHFTGLVMGEEEFRQDQLYFMARDELHQRGLHGYGVVSGLGVSLRTNLDTGHPEVVVAAGMAVNPRGESICVPLAQCGDLNEWLENNRDDLLGSPPLLLPGSATLYLVLCARDCETDSVPVLGDPCRTLEDATAASRIADDFEICLRLDPPQQLEEAAVRELGELLRSIEVSDSGGGLSPEALADLVRALVPTGSPPEVGQIEPEVGSPPLTLRLHPDDVAAALALVHRVWIHEVRPALNPETGTCEAPRDGDDGRCVLLACLELAYDEGAAGLEVSGTVDIDSHCGPILVQTRLLQEMLLSAVSCSVVSPALGSPATGGVPDAGGSPPNAGSGPVSHSDLIDLDADDHSQYLLVDPATRGLVTDLPAAGNLITGLGEPGVPAGDEAVRWDRAVKNGDTAGGDLSGTYPNPQVDALQGNPVAPTTLTAADAGNVLVWDGGAWRPGTLPLEQGLTRIIALSWRHSRQTQLQLTHDGGAVFGLAIGFGTGPDAQAPVQARTLNNETFRVFLRLESNLDTTLPVFLIAELRPQAVLPVNVEPPVDLILETRSPGRDEDVNGVLFLIDAETASTLVEEGRELFIELAGDHVRDAEGRAIDAEFPRSDLPSGDGPGSAELGIQGGRFESWVTAGRPPILIDGRDINRIAASELVGLPGIDATLANRIVDFRERRNGLETIEDLANLRGVPSTLLENLRVLLGR